MVNLNAEISEQVVERERAVTPILTKRARRVNLAVSQIHGVTMFKVSTVVILALATILIESTISRTVGGEPDEPPRFEDYPTSRTF